MLRKTAQEVYDNFVATGEQTIEVEIAVKKLSEATIQSQWNVARQGPDDDLPAPIGKFLPLFVASSRITTQGLKFMS
jgi:hypothetical protein